MGPLAGTPLLWGAVRQVSPPLRVYPCCPRMEKSPGKKHPLSFFSAFTLSPLRRHMATSVYPAGAVSSCFLDRATCGHACVCMCVYVSVCVLQAAAGLLHPLLPAAVPPRALPPLPPVGGCVLPLWQSCHEAAMWQQRVLLQVKPLNIIYL